MAVFQVRRLAVDALSGPALLSNAPADLPFVAGECLSALYPETYQGEQAWQDGKVHNLRQAAEALDGLLLTPGAVFSFWRQVGRTTRARGYVEGRMLQEGCVIPAVGGGLCQLSGALYHAALEAGCDIIERHPHSRVVPGSTAALTGLDATVAWNYVDLRFSSHRPLRLEVRVSDSDLAVRFRAAEPGRAALPETAPRPVDLTAAGPIRSCDSCSQVACFRHRDPAD